MSEPVPGDGVVTLPVEIKEDEMPEKGVDLPESVAQQMMTETAGNIQAANLQARSIFALASGALQAGIAKTHNELGPVESRAVGAVMATPIASPTTQAGGQ